MDRTRLRRLSAMPRRGSLRAMLRAVLTIGLLALSGCSAARLATHEELATSIETTYDRWLYEGSADGRHRFTVRSVHLDGLAEVVDEREVEVAQEDLPLLTTMPPTAVRSRWVEFFSRAEAAHPVGEGMAVARIRRSLSYIPAPFGTDPPR